MEGLKSVGVTELNTDVELLGAVNINDTDMLLNTKFRIMLKHGGERYESLRTIATGLPNFFRRFIVRDKKLAVEWYRESAVSSTLEWVLESPKEFTPWFTAVLQGQGYFDDHPAVKAKSITANLLKIAKVDKNNIATLANSVRALAEYYGIENVEDLIKQVNTTANLINKTLYVYKTHRNIENHYNTLSSSSNLVSCMTKGKDVLIGSHWVKVDKEKAQSAGYAVSTRGGEAVVFTPNVASYNNSPDIALGLVSFLSPDELSTAENYAFEGRMILWKGTNEGKDEWRFIRFYGREGISDQLRELLPKADSAVGYSVRGYMSTQCNRTDDLRIETPLYIAPYIDGEDSLFVRTGEQQFDELGRPYYMFEIVEGTRHSIDDRPSDYKGENYFYLTGNTWQVQPAKWRATCVITGNEISELSGWVVDGEAVRYDLAHSGFSIAQLKGLKSCFDTSSKPITRQLEKAQDEIRQLNVALDERSARVTELRDELAERSVPFQLEWIERGVRDGDDILRAEVDSCNKWLRRASMRYGSTMEQALQICRTTFEREWRKFYVSNITVAPTELALSIVLNGVINALKRAKRNEPLDGVQVHLDGLIRYLREFNQLLTAKTKEVRETLATVANIEQVDEVGNVKAMSSTTYQQDGNGTDLCNDYNLISQIEILLGRCVR